MKEIFDLLSEKERRTVGWLCLLLVVPLVFLLFIARGERQAYVRTLEDVSVKEKTYQELVSRNSEKEKEWLRWQETVQDIKDISEKYFYKDNNAFEELRKNLEKIFNQIGVYASRKNYDYADLRKGNLKKVIASFDWKGTYPSLKRFLHAVEKFPKFLIVEKIDFLNINSQGGVLELKVTLAGYYEE